MYTDGSCCSESMWDGGWGVLMYVGDRKIQGLDLWGYTPNTTSNAMELRAAIQGLSELKYRCYVTIFTDSNYLFRGINQKWVSKWRYRGRETGKYITSAGTIAKNLNLWLELERLCRLHNVRCVKVEGHADDKRNKYADMLARKGRRSCEFHDKRQRFAVKTNESGIRVKTAEPVTIN